MKCGLRQHRSDRWPAYGTTVLFSVAAHVIGRKGRLRRVNSAHECFGHCDGPFIFGTQTFPIRDIRCDGHEFPGLRASRLNAPNIYKFTNKADTCFDWPGTLRDSFKGVSCVKNQGLAQESRKSGPTGYVILIKAQELRDSSKQVHPIEDRAKSGPGKGPGDGSACILSHSVLASSRLPHCRMVLPILSQSVSAACSSLAKLFEASLENACEIRSQTPCLPFERDSISWNGVGTWISIKFGGWFRRDSRRPGTGSGA